MKRTHPISLDLDPFDKLSRTTRVCSWGGLTFALLPQRLEAAHGLDEVGVELEEGDEAGQVEDLGDVGRHVGQA